MTKIIYGFKKSRAIPVYAWIGPKGSRRSKLPDFMINERGKVASPKHRQTLPPPHSKEISPIYISVRG